MLKHPGLEAVVIPTVTAVRQNFGSFKTSTIPLCLVHVPTPAARLQGSRSLEAKRQYACSAPPCLYTSTSPGSQHASRAPDLHTSTPPRPSTRSMPHELLRQTLPRVHACSRPPKLDEPDATTFDLLQALALTLTARSPTRLDGTRLN